MSDKIEMMKKPQYILKESIDFAGTEIFGGGSDILQIEPGDIAGPFSHVRLLADQKLSDEYEPTDVFVAKFGNDEIRMPVASSFKVNAEKAQLCEGDVYYVRRSEDAKKKKGKGAGRMMQIYAVAVKTRAPADKKSRAAAAAYMDEQAAAREARPGNTRKK